LKNRKYGGSMMYQLIGIQTKKVYCEAESRSEINKWRLDSFRKKQKRNGDGTVYVVDEPMRILKVDPSCSNNINQYLMAGFEEKEMTEYYEKSQGNSIYMFSGREDDPKIIERRKTVENLYRHDVSVDKITEKTHATKSTVRRDIYILRKIFPDLKDKNKIKAVN
jgi:hypothetical protein